MSRDEVEAGLDALTVPASLAPLGTGGAGCATPSSATNTDGDGTPDDATFTFTAPPCRFTGIRGSTLDVVGQLRIQDPVPDVAGFGYEADVAALRFTLTGDDQDDPSYSVTRNGFRTLSGTTAALQLVTNIQVVRTFTGQPDGAIEEQWTTAFTPETPLQINQPPAERHARHQRHARLDPRARKPRPHRHHPSHYDSGCNRHAAADRRGGCTRRAPRRRPRLRPRPMDRVRPRSRDRLRVVGRLIGCGAPTPARPDDPPVTPPISGRPP
jgi:hypothetical protein